VFKQHMIKRSVVSGLVIAAASFPASAQAMLIGGGASSVPSGPIASGPSASQPGAGAHSSFQWGDAGIGATGAVVLLGAGALGTSATRRRRRRRPVVS
jgi:hypothetical protein